MTFEQQIRAIEYPPGEDAALMSRAAEIASEADAFRATVAAALRELRAKIEAESDTFDSGLESWPYDHCRQMLDATIAKLGLEAE